MSGLNLRGSLSGDHMRGSNGDIQELCAEEIAKELEILLKDSQPRYEMNEREREYLFYRSGSAPPIVEASLASVGGVFSQNNLNSAIGSDFANNGEMGSLTPEEELRNYYESHANPNPRLLFREDWRSAHRLQAVSGYGGIGDRRRLKLKSLEDENSKSLFSSQPVLPTHEEEGLEVPLQTHRQQSHGSLFRQSSTDWVERGADGLIGLSTGRLGNREKNFVDLLQEDFGKSKPVYTSRSHSRPASRAAYDEDGNRVAVTELWSANSSHASISPLTGSDMALIEGLRSRSAAPCLTRVQSLAPQSSHAFSTAEGVSISRSSTPDPRFVGARSVSPCPPMVGGRFGLADKQNITFTDTYNVVSSSINETEELSAALSHLNISPNSTVGMKENHQNMEHQNHPVHLKSPQTEKQHHSKIEDQETRAEFVQTPVFTEPFLESNVGPDQDNRGIEDLKLPSDSSVSQFEGTPMQQGSGSFTPNFYAAAAGRTSDFKGSTGHYQNAHLTNTCIPNYGMSGYPINPVFPSMAGSYIDPNTVADSFDDVATATAVGATSMDSRTAMNGVRGRSGSTADLHNLYKLNGQVRNGLQMPLFNPINIQYIQRMNEYNAQMAANFSDPSMAGSYLNGPYVDLLEMQKLFYTQPESQYHTPYLEKNGTVSSGYFCNPSYHLPSPYTNSPISSPVLPSSPVAHITPSFRQIERSSRITPNTRSSVGGAVGLWRSESGSDIEEKYGSSLLEEFKTTKIRSFQLSEIVGHVLEFSADQYGSRFIQQKLETASLEEKNMVFQEIFPEALSLMTDVFGNYVIQKFFEHGTSKQRRALANQLSGHVLVLSLQMYGCRVIQKAIEVVDVDQQEKLVVELDGHVMRCVRDQNGNHVIQKCIECIPQDRIKFIISSFFGQVVPLSTHPYGCRVIQRVLEHYTDERTQHTMMEEILQSACTLAQDQYGNYVVQHVLEHGRPHERCAVIKKLAGQIVKMSQQKFASNVVEKCLAFGGPADRQILINEMLGSTDENEPLQAMMKDQYANYVVQKVLEICSDQQRELILSRIKVHLSALKKYTYGKHIVARVEKLVAAGEKRAGTKYMYLS